MVEFRSRQISDISRKLWTLAHRIHIRSITNPIISFDDRVRGLDDFKLHVSLDKY